MSRRACLGGLAVLFVTLAAYGSFVPFRWREIGWTEGLSRASELPAAPAINPFDGDFLTNVLVFLPIGFFSAGAIAPRRPSLGLALVVLLPTVALSVLIELGQVYVRDRTPSLSDVYAQWFGGFLGAMVWLFVGVALIEWVAAGTWTAAAGPWRSAGWTSKTKDAVLLWALTALLALVFVHYWAPLNFGVAERVVDQRIRLLYTRALFHRYYWLPPLVAFAEITTLALLSLSTSVLVALALRARHRVLSPRTTVLVTTLIFTIVEWGQLYLPSRRADPTDVLIAFAGGLAGVTITQALVESSPADGMIR